MKFKRKLKKSLGFQSLTQLLESVHFSKNSLISWRVGNHFEQKFPIKKLFRMKFPTFPYFQNFYMTKIEENRFSQFWARNILVHHHSVDFNPCREVREIIAPVYKFGQSEPSKILFGANNAQNQVFLKYKFQGFSNAKKHLHQIYKDKILVLSIFRANHKNDQKFM